MSYNHEIFSQLVFIQHKAITKPKTNFNTYKLSQYLRKYKGFICDKKSHSIRVRSLLPIHGQYKHYWIQSRAGNPFMLLVMWNTQLYINTGFNRLLFCNIIKIYECQYNPPIHTFYVKVQ